MSMPGHSDPDYARRLALDPAAMAAELADLGVLVEDTDAG